MSCGRRACRLAHQQQLEDEDQGAAGGGDLEEAGTPPGGGFHDGGEGVRSRTLRHRGTTLCENLPVTYVTIKLYEQRKGGLWSIA